MVEGFSSYGRDVVRRLRADAVLWLAFAALLAWMFGLYWSDLLVRPSFGSLDLLQMRALWLGSEAATLLVALICSKRAIERMGEAAVALGSGTCLFLGTAIIVFGPYFAAPDVLSQAGVVLTGVGSALLLVLLGVSLALEGAKALLIDVSLALLAASVLDTVIMLAVPVAQQLALALLPGLSAGLLVLSQSASAKSPVHLQRAGDERPRFSTVRVVALPAIVGVAFGLMQRLVEGVNAANAGSGDAATIASFALSAVMIAFVALFLDARKLIKAICFAAIPVMGIAFVMLPLFSDAREAIQGVCIVGFNSFYFIVWALWADEREGAALPRRFTLGLLVLVGSESLGSLLGVPVVKAVEGSGATLAVVSLVVVYCLLMAGIFSFNRSMRLAVDSSETRTAGSKDSESLDACSERFGLSAREREVFEMLARGRNRAYISKALVVSDNTTRTHMKNVYRKLGVHSQQELIDFVERHAGREGEPR